MASTLTQPNPITIPWASVGNKRTIPILSQIGVVDGDGKASYPDGYPPLCGTPLTSGGKPPSILDMNGAMFDITSNLRFLLGGGCPKFDATMAAAINGYPLGAVLQDNSGLNRYQSLVDGNTTNFNTTPASIGVSWEKLSIGSRAGHTYSGIDWCWLDKANGLILQWVSGAVATTSGALTTLPVTFPHAALWVGGTISANSTTISSNGWVGVSSPNTSQVLCISAQGSPAVNVFAIGR